eukprot:s1464_g7.t1
MSANGDLKNVPTIKAYKNPDWLGSPTSRHIRIMCELYEPMKRLDDNNIDNYFIIVGSHLVMDPEDRVKHINGLEQQLKKITAEEEVEAVQAKLRFAKKMQNMDKFYVMARELGEKLGKWNRERAAVGKPSYNVSTGGGPGIMEAANRGAHEAGDTTLGFGASRPEWGSLNRYVSNQGAFEFHYFFMRKFWMAYKCMGLVVMPGVATALAHWMSSLRCWSFCRPRRSRIRCQSSCLVRSFGRRPSTLITCWSAGCSHNPIWICWSSKTPQRMRSSTWWRMLGRLRKVERQNRFNQPSADDWRTSPACQALLPRKINKQKLSAPKGHKIVLGIQRCILFRTLGSDVSPESFGAEVLMLL